LKNNVTGGVILFLVGAGIIAMGTTAKGKQILAIITGGATTGELPEKPGLNGEEYYFSGTPTDPDYKSPSGTSNMFGFIGERGAKNAG
jgi:hypothetical protein